MNTITRNIIENEKENLQKDIFSLAVNTSKRINILGGRLRKLKSQIDSEEFTIYLEGLPISQRTAYNWMKANERIEAGENPENISKLYIIESAESARFATFAKSVVDSKGCLLYTSPSPRD